MESPSKKCTQVEIKGVSGNSDIDFREAEMTELRRLHGMMTEIVKGEWTGPLSFEILKLLVKRVSKPKERPTDESTSFFAIWLPRRWL